MHVFSDNKIIIECLIIGIITSICCLISYKIIYYSHNKDVNGINNYHLTNINDYIMFLKIRESRNNILMSFVFGALVHYIIKQSHLTELYCKKVCYDDKCFIVCNINK
jgi:magnesium-transporting ATPase (P-type)